MTQSDIIQKTADYIREQFESDSSGHDWWHIYRVWKNALAICQHENADQFIVELAALLHDLDDWKLAPENDGTPVRAQAWMRELGLGADVSAHVSEIIQHLSFKGAQVENKIRTIEGMIVQDADRLDAIGAIGIGRAFAYGGHKGRLMYDPDAPPEMHASFERYKNSQSATINHFHEKLFLLKERMNTDTARRIAEQRHAFMQEFVDRFMLEWDGKDFTGAS